MVKMVNFMLCIVYHKKRPPKTLCHRLASPRKIRWNLGDKV